MTTCCRQFGLRFNIVASQVALWTRVTMWSRLITLDMPCSVASSTQRPKYLIQHHLLTDLEIISSYHKHIVSVYIHVKQPVFDFVCGLLFALCESGARSRVCSVSCRVPGEGWIVRFIISQAESRSVLSTCENLGVHSNNIDCWSSSEDVDQSFGRWEIMAPRLVSKSGQASRKSSYLLLTKI